MSLSVKIVACRQPFRESFKQRTEVLFAGAGTEISYKNTLSI